MFSKEKKRILFLGALTGAGMVAGLSREFVIAYYFGTSQLVDVFRLANGVPGILSEGVAVSSVSLYLAYLNRPSSQNSIRDSSSALCIFVIMFFALFAVTGAFTTGLQRFIVAPGLSVEETDLYYRIGAYCWLSFFVVNCATYYRAMAGWSGVVWVGAASVLVRSGVLAVSLIVAMNFSGHIDSVTILGSSLLFASLVLLVFFYRLAPVARPSSAMFSEIRVNFVEFQQLGKSIILVFVSSIFLASARLMDRAVCNIDSLCSVSALEYSYAILMALVSVVTTVVTVAFAPKIASYLSVSRVVPSHLAWFCLVAFIVLSVVGVTLSQYSYTIAYNLFYRGEFTLHDVESVAGFMYFQCMALGLIVCVFLCNQVFILSGNTRYVAHAALARVLPRAAVVFFLLPEYGIVVALGMGLVIGELIALVFAIYIMIARVGISLK